MWCVGVGVWYLAAATAAADRQTARERAQPARTAPSNFRRSGALPGRASKSGTTTARTLSLCSSGAAAGAGRTHCVAAWHRAGRRRCSASSTASRCLFPRGRWLRAAAAAPAHALTVPYSYSSYAAVGSHHAAYTPRQRLAKSCSPMLPAARNGTRKSCSPQRCLRPGTAPPPLPLTPTLPFPPPPLPPTPG